MKILVIDDNEDITFSIKISLEKLDETYEILRAHTGEDGIKMAEAEEPQLILLDVMIPDMSGWMISQALKSSKKTKNIPIVFLTAKGDDISKQMGQHGGAAYITKPFDVKELDKTIKNLLR